MATSVMSRNGVGGGGQSRNSQVESKCQAAEAEHRGRLMVTGELQWRPAPGAGETL